MKWFASCFLTLSFGWLTSCIDPFEPQIPVQATKALVVDGFINSNGRSTIKLSRSFDLKSSAGPLREINAQVFIQAKGAPEQYQLREVLPGGTYVSDSLVLNPQLQYRLMFRTRDRKEYASEYEVVKTTPAIDSLSWKLVPRGLELYVNTHDPARKSIYYRWDFIETWEFTSYAESKLKYENGEMLKRTDNIFRCWKSVFSPQIKTFNTRSLSEDRVTEFPLVNFTIGDTRLRYKYSVLVKQYALSDIGFKYWEILKKNTESIGSIFDPLPTQSFGNIHSVSDRAEIVIGYIGVGTVTDKRIFIKSYQLPRWLFDTGNPPCGLADTIVPLPFIPFREVLEQHFGSGDHIPIATLYGKNGGIRGYTSFPVECVDCRLRGTNVTPSFW